ncbi:MAG: ABC transporter substrate-binding protein [Desulfotalea sp.]
MLRKKLSIFYIVALSIFLQTSGAVAEEYKDILLGQSSPFSGDSGNLGNEMRAGLQAAFAWVNDSGGVNGRKIKLITKDDGYEPDKAVENSEKFIADGVFALIGQVGTPTSKAVLPIVTEKGVPFFSPLTGAEFLRRPFNRNVITIRASYYQEIETIIDYLVGKKGYSRIACFYQNDSYGYDGLRGLETSLSKRGMALVGKASYERNTVAVMGAVREINDSSPEAIIMVGAYAACAEFIKLSKSKFNSKTTFASISFVGTESLRNVLGDYGKDVIVSQVVPNPYISTIKLVKEYKRDMTFYRHDVPLSFNSFEGYIAGKLFTSIARQTPAPLTRKSFIETMEKIGSFDLGGMILKFGPHDHQGIDDVFIVRIYPEIQTIDTSGDGSE